MITIKLDKHTAEDIEAIQTLREFGYSDEEIQELYDLQKRKDEKEATNERSIDKHSSEMV